MFLGSRCHGNSTRGTKCRSGKDRVKRKGGGNKRGVREGKYGEDRCVFAVGSAKTGKRPLGREKKKKGGQRGLAGADKVADGPNTLKTH